MKYLFSLYVCLAKLFQAALNQFTFGCRRNKGSAAPGVRSRFTDGAGSGTVGITQPMPCTRHAPCQQ